MYIKGLYELKLSVQALKDKLKKAEDDVSNAEEKESDKESKSTLRTFYSKILELENNLCYFELDMKDVE